MTNEGNLALIEALSQKYRENALRVFISGLRRPMSDVLFSCKPSDMPSALALAQELETNHTRYNFATTFWNNSAQGISYNSPHYQPVRQPYFHNRPVQQNFIPRYQINNRFQIPHNPTLNTNEYSNRFTTPSSHPHQNATFNRNSNRMQFYDANYRQNAEPMEVDISTRFNQQYQKRPADSLNQNISKIQRVNYFYQHNPTDNYLSYDANEPPGPSFDYDPPEPQPSFVPQVQNCEQDLQDEINFLEPGPSCRT